MSVESPLCPYCDVLLSRDSSVVMIDAHGEQQIETKHVCIEEGCGYTWDSYIEAASIFSVVGARFVKKNTPVDIGTVCAVCNQPSDPGSMCGCS